MIKNKKINIAFLHLKSNGDVLYATTIAKQIKEIDFPNCHLTWFVASSCKKILENNPYVDKIIEIDCTLEEASSTTWELLKEDILHKKKIGVYDEVFFTQISPDNWYKYDGTVRSSTFNNYPFKISVAINPILVLNKQEITNVEEFVKDNNIEKYNNVILFECSPNSNQSFININLSLIIAKNIVNKNSNTCIILSSPNNIVTEDVRIINGSKLSFRENAELTKYCTLLIGCSSGITWISTSTAAKQLPMLQLLNNNEKSIFASVEYDFTYFKQDTSNIIEITNQDINYIVDCVICILNKGIKEAKLKFGEKLKPKPNFYFDTTFYQLFKMKKYTNLIEFIIKYSLRNKLFFVILFRIISIAINSIKYKIKNRLI